MSHTIQPDPHDTDENGNSRTAILTITPDKAMTCPVDHRPCQPDTKFGDQSRCRVWWGNEVVAKKCREWRAGK